MYSYLFLSNVFYLCDFQKADLVLISLALTIIITGEIQNTNSTLSMSNDLDISNSMTQV